MDPFESVRELDFPLGVVVTDAVNAVGAYGDTTTPYPWASVTKLLSATAALVAVDRGLVDLDAPAGPEGSTVRHLLAHTSGLPFDGGATLGTPGRRRVYSNLGIESLGEHVAEAVGTDFTTWVEQSVIEPLHMSTVVLDGSPAHAAAGSAEDLAVLAREFLRPTLVSADLFAAATTVVFPGLAGVLPGYGRQEHNDWGLGFEIRDHKSPHWTGQNGSPATFGHFGQSGSFLWVDPETHLGTVFVGARSFGEWAVQAWPPLSDAILAHYAPTA